MVNENTRILTYKKHIFDPVKLSDIGKRNPPVPCRIVVNFQDYRQKCHDKICIQNTLINLGIHDTMTITAISRALKIQIEFQSCKRQYAYEKI